MGRTNTTNDHDECCNSAENASRCGNSSQSNDTGDTDTNNPTTATDPTSPTDPTTTRQKRSTPAKPVQQGFNTRQIHAGYTPETPIGAAVPPIYQTTSFVFDSCEQAAARFELREPGQIYTRITNPSNDILEARIADLEGGVGALLTSSGTSAILATVLTIAQAGNSIVSSPSLYGGTLALFRERLRTLGIDVRFVEDANDPAQWARLADASTVAFFGETIPNPRNGFLDIETIAEAAHSVGVPLIVDNTVASPYLTRPFEWGADIVVHSVTKYLAGHGNSILGAIVDGGRFDWAAQPGRFPLLTTPDTAYHGLRYSDLGEAAFITRARVATLRDYGVSASPFNAFLATIGVETLSLRMEKHCANALKIAQYLETHPAVTGVSYAGLASSPWHALQQKYAPRGASGIVTFEVAGGAAAGQALVDALKLFTHLVNIGDVRSLVSHPASTTHAQCDEAALAAAGITPGTVRLSVGLEDADDLIADLAQALNVAAAASGHIPSTTCANTSGTTSGDTSSHSSEATSGTTCTNTSTHTDTNCCNSGENA